MKAWESPSTYAEQRWTLSETRTVARSQARKSSVHPWRLLLETNQSPSTDDMYSFAAEVSLSAAGCLSSDWTVHRPRMFVRCHETQKSQREVERKCRKIGLVIFGGAGGSRFLTGAVAPYNILSYQITDLGLFNDDPGNTAHIFQRPASPSTLLNLKIRSPVPHTVYYT